MNGEHVMRHKKGIWNGIWSTFMSYGHGPRGIVGLTLKPESLKKWAYSINQSINQSKHMCKAL